MTKSQAAVTPARRGDDIERIVAVLAVLRMPPPIAWPTRCGLTDLNGDGRADLLALRRRERQLLRRAQRRERPHDVPRRRGTAAGSGGGGI